MIIGCITAIVLPGIKAASEANQDPYPNQTLSQAIRMQHAIHINEIKIISQEGTLIKEYNGNYGLHKWFKKATIINLDTGEEIALSLGKSTLQYKESV